MYGNLKLREKKVRTFLLLLSFCCLSIPLTAQTADKKISYQCKNEKLSVVFEQLERLSGYYRLQFAYSDIEGYTVTVDLKEVTVPQAVGELIAGKPLTYAVENQYIYVKTQRGGVKSSSNKVTFWGTVVDDLDMPLPGVNVAVKGQQGIGTTTNVNGDFSISLPEGKQILVFSYIGMKTQEVRASEGKKLTVRLEPDAIAMKETVVTGIYTRKAESFTGSAATYKAEELKAIGNQNILQSLSALDPSFVIADNNLMGSDPNTMMNVTINGTTSITGLSDTYSATSNQPLFVLDGFETTLQTISDLSMDRVESITILKDAASTAIYGSKAANGVIVVETKKPEAGKLRFSYSGNYEIAWPDLSDYNLMNSREKLEFERLSGYYGDFDEFGELMDDAQRTLYYSRLQRAVAGLDTYWMNEPLRTALTHEHSLNAEGGDSAFRYGLTFRYKDQEGVMKNSDRENLDGTVNLSYRIDKFSFSNQTNISYTDISNEVVPFSDFSTANPYQSKYNSTGGVDKIIETYYLSSKPTEPQYVYNPLWDFRQKSFNTSNLLSIRNNFQLEYRPIDKMRIIAKFGLVTSKLEQEIFKSPFATAFNGTESLKSGSLDQNNLRTTNYDGSLIASYGDVIGKHTFNIVGGAQLSENNDKSNMFSTIGYISDQFSNPNFSIGYPEGGRPTSTIVKTRSASFYLNGNYAYDMRYLLDLNVRSDGASVFGVNNPFSTTWSFGLGWNLHNESFLKDSELINFLKLRYSLGNPGNQEFNAKIANSVYTYYTTYQNMFGLATLVEQWGNKNLKWQRTLTHNVGFDLELFNSRLRLTVDYGLKKSDPALLSIGMPPSTGTTSIPMNIGATKNNNFSFSVNYFIFKEPDLTWQVNANLLHTKTSYYNIGDGLEKYNKDGRENQTLLRYYDGVSSTAMWAVRSLGIDPMSGNEVFLKKDGTYTYEWDSSEEVICGDLTPDAEGNLGSTVRYKGFSLGVNFHYKWGGQAFLRTLFDKVENISETAIKYNQDKRALYDRWQKPGDIAKYKRIDDTSATPMSSRFIMDENTLECQSLSLGYDTTTASWLRPIGVSYFSFRVYMNNLFRISTIKEERGLSYPYERSVSASLSLRF